MNTYVVTYKLSEKDEKKQTMTIEAESVLEALALLKSYKSKFILYEIKKDTTLLLENDINHF